MRREQYDRVSREDARPLRIILAVAALAVLVIGALVLVLT